MNNKDEDETPELRQTQIKITLWAMGLIAIAFIAIVFLIWKGIIH